LRAMWTVMSVITCPSNLLNCSGVNSRSTFPRPACRQDPGSRCRGESFRALNRGAEGAHWRNRRAQVLCQECAMLTLMQNKGHMNAVHLWSRRALRLTPSATPPSRSNDTINSTCRRPWSSLGGSGPRPSAFTCVKILKMATGRWGCAGATTLPACGSIRNPRSCAGHQP
jgi:hypothetical protein